MTGCKKSLSATITQFWASQRELPRDQVQVAALRNGFSLKELDIILTSPDKYQQVACDISLVVQKRIKACLMQLSTPSEDISVADGIDNFVRLWESLRLDIEDATDLTSGNKNGLKNCVPDLEDLLNDCFDSVDEIYNMNFAFRSVVCDIEKQLISDCDEADEDDAFSTIVQTIKLYLDASFGVESTKEINGKKDYLARSLMRLKLYEFIFSRIYTPLFARKIIKDSFAKIILNLCRIGTVNEILSCDYEFDKKLTSGEFSTFSTLNSLPDRVESVSWASCTDPNLSERAVEFFDDNFAAPENIIKFWARLLELFTIKELLAYILDPISKPYSH